MTDIISKSLWPFSVRVPSMFEEDDAILTPSTNSGLGVSEDEKHVFVQAHVPGIPQENIETVYQKGILWVKASIKEEDRKDRKHYRLASTSFQYRVAVPGDIDESIEPEATYENGVLTVTFTKQQQAQPKKISIKKN